MNSPEIKGGWDLMPKTPDLTRNLSTIFDEKYFEDGVRSRVSAYENYRWMPERSIREASSIINNIPFTTVLDYGCAKGFMVYALRLLGKEAHGVDVSDYAVKNCHPRVKDYLTVVETAEDIKGGWDLIIAKDVLEHIPEKNIDETLSEFYKVSDKCLLVIPLGDNDSFRIREYEIDKTHVTKKDEEWWINKIKKSGFKLKHFSYSFGNVKEKWTSTYKYGNGFFIIEK